MKEIRFGWGWVAGALLGGLLLAGGTATAASLITSKQIQDHTIRAADMRTGAVDSRVVSDGSLSPADFSSDARDALKGDPGTNGVDGAPGPGIVASARVNVPLAGSVWLQFATGPIYSVERALTSTGLEATGAFCIHADVETSYKVFVQPYRNFGASFDSGGNFDVTSRVDFNPRQAAEGVAGCLGSREISVYLTNGGTRVDESFYIFVIA